MRRTTIFLALLVIATLTTNHVKAQTTVVVPLTRLPGLAGPPGSGTAIFRGDLGATAVAELFSLRFTDSNSGIGGSPGQYSGFDLDAIRISDNFATTAAEASSAIGLSVFDFTPIGTTFNPGTQRPPVDSKLNGTDATGMNVDPVFATLDEFDGVFFTSGSVTLGDGGSIGFALTTPIATTGRYIYLGELSGDAGENIAGTLEISSIPEPACIPLLFGGFIGLAFRRYRNNEG